MEPSSDRNADEIVFEGVCYKPGVHWHIFWHVFITSILIITAPIVIPVGIIWCYRSFKHWKLHLTHSNIVYRSTTPYGVLERDIVIPLGMVQDITFQEKVGRRNVVVQLNPAEGERAEIFDCYNHPSVVNNNPAVTLPSVANAKELVEAVKKEKNLA